MELSNEQRLAALHTSGVTVCTAGPGSGKTTVLVRRIVEAAGQPNIGHNCVILTFTNAAANEMRTRLGALLPGEVERFAHIGTLHSWLLKLLGQHYELLGMHQPVTVVDEETATAILESAKAALRYKGTVKELDAALESNPLLNRPSGPLSPAQTVALHYYREMVQNGFATFDDILTYGLALVREMASGMPFSIGAVFVDEAQDSGPTDWAIYRVLQSVASSCFMVGDYNQSIYGFRGAYPDGMREAAGQRVSLQDNYRSTPEVCAAAERLIRHNPGNDAVEIRPISKQRGEVRVWPCLTETAEAVRLAEAIAAKPSGNTCAVLCRTNWQAANIAGMLRGFGIKVRERKLAKRPDDWSLTKTRIALLANPSNDTLALRHLTAKLGHATATELARGAAAAYLPLNKHAMGFERYTGPVSRNLLDLLATIGCSQEAVWTVRDIMAQLPDAAEIADLMLAVNSHEMEQTDDGEGVDVCTIHAAKGREWDHVFLPGWVEKCFPNPRANEQEELRLAFVAVTRARYTVEVFTTEERRTNSFQRKPEPTTPSRFVAELIGGES